MLLFAGFAATGLVSRPASAAGIDLSMLSQVRPLLTTAGDPTDNSLYGTPLHSGFDGVGMLFVDFAGGASGLCSASRIGPRQILTAAHCVTDGAGIFIATSAQVGFFPADGGGSILEFPVVTFNVHPDWTGNLLAGADLAVLELSGTPPTSVDTYGLFTNAAADLGAVFNKVGFGESGNGNTGVTLTAGTRRQGQNTYEDTIGSNILVYDFDNGEAAQNVLALIGGTSSLGLGENEVMAAPGDSGGPSFINGLIAGITSFGGQFAVGDIDGALNSSFGEVGGDSRITSYLDFITGFLDSGPVVTIGEPSSLALFAAGLVLLLLPRQRRQAGGLFGGAGRQA